VAYSREQFAPAWRRFRASLPLPDGVLEAGERLCGDRSVLDRMSLDPCTLTHGDLRLNNLMFSEDEDGRFSAAIDWQSVTFARGPGDLAALLIGNMSPTACAASEDELVRQYHDRLIASGVTGYGFEACWSDYRLGALAHFASMVMLSAFMDLGGNRGETADAIVGRPVAAVERLCLAELLPRRRASARIVARVRAAFGRG
jgi:hypothetical protein